MISLWLLFACYLAGGVLSLLVKARQRGFVTVMSCVGALVSAVWASAGFLATGEPETWLIPLADPLGTVALVLDGLSVFFALLVATVGVPASLFFQGWLKRHSEARLHTFVFHLLFASMMAVVLVQSVLAFLVVWEIMSMASALLIAFDHRKEEVRGAVVSYLVTMHVGVALLLCGFFAALPAGGSQDFAELGAVLGSGSVRGTWAFLLLFAGFGMKAGLVPLHSWRPRCYPLAPAPIAGVMSGLMLKVAVYAILRTVSLSAQPPLWLAILVGAVGLASAFLGIVQSLAEKDMRRILAYSSIENAGLLVFGIGVAMTGSAVGNALMAELGVMACLVHCVNHAFLKPLLFFAAGVLENHCGTRNIEKMGGLARKLPRLASCFLVGVLAACGLPPFNGFVSKFLLFSAMIAGFVAEGRFVSVTLIVAMAITAFVSMTAIVSFVRLFGIAFLGTWRGEGAEPPPAFGMEMGPGTRWAFLILVAACVLLGLVPLQVLDFTQAATAQVLQASAVGQGSDALFEPVVQLSLVSAFFLMIFFALNAWRMRLVARSGVRRFKTWDCGYQGRSARIQYTAFSFPAPFLQLMRHLFSQRVTLEKPQGLFPARVAFAAEGEDVVDGRLVAPFLGLLRRMLGLLGWVQSGHTQRYILYGLVFLAAALLWVMGVQP